MKVRASLKKLCPKCRFVRRGRHLYIYCENTRHKRKQG